MELLIVWHFARVSRLLLFTLMKGWASSAVDKWSCWCVGVKLVSWAQTPRRPAHLSQSNRLFTYKWWLINFCLSWVQLWFLRCGDSCAPVGSVSLSGAFLLGPVSRCCVDLSDVLSVNTAGMIFILNPSVSGWRKLRFDEWMAVSSPTHTFMSQGLNWITDSHTVWSFCGITFTITNF